MEKKCADVESVIIKNVIVPLPNGARGCQRAHVVVEEGKITHVVRFSDGEVAEVPAVNVRSEIDGSEKLLLPGMMNAHTHSSEMWMRGEADMLPLELWLAAIRDFGMQDPKNLYYSAVLTALETLKSGGTTLVDHIFPLPGHFVESVESVVRAYKDIGIRAFVAPLVDDLAMADSYPTGSERKEFLASRTKEILGNMREVIEKFHRPEEGIHILVGPTGAHLCSDELLKGCADLSDEYDLGRHLHILETKAQRNLAVERHGCTAVAHLRDIGFLNSKTSCAHSVWLTDDDVDIYAQCGVTAVHNPLSNVRLGSGISPVLKMRQKGVNVSFGCDGAASNDGQDLLEAVKIGMMLHNMTEAEYKHWINPFEAIQMASLGASRGLGVDNTTGTIEEGKDADLVLYDLTQTSLLPRTDPVGLLIMGHPVNVVETSWVRGRRILDGGQVMCISEDWLRKELLARSEWKLTPRISETKDKLEADFRAAMNIQK